MKPSIIILDFGSQYTQLLARRIRDLSVYCEVWPFDVSPEKVLEAEPGGFILSGGPDSVYVDSALRIPDFIFELNLPVLGVCYGMQAMALQQGGEVAPSLVKEFGLAYLNIQQEDPLLQGFQSQTKVWMSHGDAVTVLPPGFKCLASSDNAPIAVMRHEVKPWYGVQFHPEVTHTDSGSILLHNFLSLICHASSNWVPEKIYTVIEEEVRQKVAPHERVLLGLSGGVDSLVLGVLLHRLLGSRLSCLFIDTGLMREQEALHLSRVFLKLALPVIQVDAAQEFLTALKGVVDPEAKRKIMGQVFIDVFAREALALPSIDYLAQGTIYSDVIESGQGSTHNTHVIKSHHNVGGLPDTLPFALLEPFRRLFKDEVRQLGRSLGLSEKLIMRHPFPGPGLGVRIMGEVLPLYVRILQQADAIFLAVLRKKGWYRRCAQAFAVFLPVKSVGVVGDVRQYEYVIALRAVSTTDFMTAAPVKLPHSLLQEVANRIVNEVPHVSRVTYDITGKPPATIEWE